MVDAGVDVRERCGSASLVGSIMVRNSGRLSGPGGLLEGDFPIAARCTLLDDVRRGLLQRKDPLTRMDKTGDHVSYCVTQTEIDKFRTNGIRIKSAGSVV